MEERSACEVKLRADEISRSAGGDPLGTENRAPIFIRDKRVPLPCLAATVRTPSTRIIDVQKIVATASVLNSFARER